MIILLKSYVGEIISMMFVQLFNYSLPIVLVGGPIAFIGSKRCKWYAWEIISVLFPLIVWYILFYNMATGKSLTNAAIEPLYLGGIITIFIIVRVIVAPKIKINTMAIIFMVLGILPAIIIWWKIPGLPE